MKKSLFFAAAASALLLTACSSENDLVQTGPQKTVENQAVGFDVYTPGATETRAGLQGTMTTDRMKRSEINGGGFGVYSFLTSDADAAIGDDHAGKYASTDGSTANIPNFMVNEKLLWNATNQGWYYNPLKYWPNETDFDSQNTNAEMQGDGTNHHLDRLTFFAYAPYVSAGVNEEGITDITDKAGLLGGAKTTDPTISYKAAIDNPNKAVDLLWGVAPAGGLTYTAVNGRTVTVDEGMPLIDMTKPDVNTTMKFLFQHALARIGVKAVAAVDQVGAGGKLDPNTKITIEKITLKGYFGKSGDLNLNNTLQANHTTPADGTIATHLQWVDDADANPDAQVDRVGVTTVKQDVIQPSMPGSTTKLWASSKTYAANELAYSETTPYYTDAACTTPATVTMPASYTIDSKGVYTYNASDAAFAYPKVLQNYKKGSGFEVVTADEVTAKTYDNYAAYTNYRETGAATVIGTDYVYKSGAYVLSVTGDESLTAYTKLADGVYIPKAGKPLAGDYVVKEGIYFYALVATNAADFADVQLYANGGGGTTFSPKAVGSTPAAGDYVVCGQKELFVPYYAADTYYKRDANYFMVVPTNNFVNMNSGLASNEEKLRTVRVMIEYYITTEDSKLNAGRAQTKNVIEKDVVFPSIANGKSYNLNLILGLTSVKMEAEVDDWKVINVNGDLPQNTAE